MDGLGGRVEHARSLHTDPLPARRSAPVRRDRYWVRKNSAPNSAKNASAMDALAARRPGSTRSLAPIQAMQDPLGQFHGTFPSHHASVALHEPPDHDTDGQVRDDLWTGFDGDWVLAGGGRGWASRLRRPEPWVFQVAASSPSGGRVCRTFRGFG